MAQKIKVTMRVFTSGYRFLICNRSEYCIPITLFRLFLGGCYWPRVMDTVLVIGENCDSYWS